MDGSDAPRPPGIPRGYFVVAGAIVVAAGVVAATLLFINTSNRRNDAQRAAQARAAAFDHEICTEARTLVAPYSDPAHGGGNGGEPKWGILMLRAEASKDAALAAAARESFSQYQTFNYTGGTHTQSEIDANAAAAAKFLVICLSK